MVPRVARCKWKFIATGNFTVNGKLLGAHNNAYQDPDPIYLRNFTW